MNIFLLPNPPSYVLYYSSLGFIKSCSCHLSKNIAQNPSCAPAFLQCREAEHNSKIPQESADGLLPRSIMYAI